MKPTLKFIKWAHEIFVSTVIVGAANDGEGGVVKDYKQWKSNGIFLFSKALEKIVDEDGL